ncbi:MAG: zf-TFIIB domain-containing protein [Pseudomonadales bacterium]
MECPKCQAKMEEVTYGRTLTVDRCTGCKGLWFDVGEAESLKGKWMSEFVDSGDPDVGKEYNKIEQVGCPRCAKIMDKLADPDQPHIWYEACPEHGLFFDAGEFTDYKYETLLDKFRSLVARKRT